MFLFYQLIRESPFDLGEADLQISAHRRRRSHIRRVWFKAAAALLRCWKTGRGLPICVGSGSQRASATNRERSYDWHEE